MGVAAAVCLAAGVILYVFWPQRAVTHTVRKTRLEYLQERREVIYDNLRDLNFEYRAGKHPEPDFLLQRDSLETEAANVLAEMDVLEALKNRPSADRPALVKR